MQNEEVLDTIYEIKNELRNPEFELNELRDTVTIQVLDDLVSEADQINQRHHNNLSVDGDIGQIMQYHESDVIHRLFVLL